MFKIGDKVRVIHNNDGMRFGHVERMDQYVGRITTIKSCVDGVNKLEIDDDHWSWDNRSLEHVNTFHVGDVVRSNANGHYTYLLTKDYGDNRFDVQTLTALPHVEGRIKFINCPVFDKDYTVIQKYHLRNAKGHYIKCDRYVNPLEAAVKRRKPVAKGVGAIMPDKAPVAPIKPLPEPPKAKDIRSELAKRAKAGHTGNRCNYSLEFDNGKIRHQAPDACHARLSWCYYQDEDTTAKEIVNIALNITAHHKQMSKGDQEVHTRFVQYMLNDSPWAPMFITKDVKEALEVGILMDVTRNVSHIVGAAVALRVATEWPVILKPFGDALDKGYSGNVAYLISGHLQHGKVSYWPGHSALTSTLSLAQIVKFFKEGYSQKDWKGIAKDKTQKSYKIHDPICPGSGYGGAMVGAGDSLMSFANKQAVSTKQGEGFDAKTVFDYEATLIKMADAFTKELT